VEVARRAREGDVVVTMGAPPISLMGDELITALVERGEPEDERPPGYVARHARTGEIPAQTATAE
jgi:UDP-N-acetylmuramate--alanine ligase